MAPHVTRHLQRAIALGRGAVRRSPGTAVYLFVLLITTAVVRSTSAALTDELLRQVSTNLFQMGRSAGRVLLLSAFLVAGSPVSAVVLFGLIYAPLERWIGSVRWLGVVVAGHVGATLVTTVGIWADVRHHRGTTALVQAVDVGPSYGLLAAAAFLALGLPHRWLRVGAAALVLARVGVPLWSAPSFTDVGHAAAAAIGAALWLLVPHGARTGRLTNPTARSSTVRPSPEVA